MSNGMIWQCLRNFKETHGLFGLLGYSSVLCLIICHNSFVRSGVRRGTCRIYHTIFTFQICGYRMLRKGSSIGSQISYLLISNECNPVCVCLDIALMVTIKHLIIWRGFFHRCIIIYTDSIIYLWDFLINTMGLFNKHNESYNNLCTPNWQRVWSSIVIKSSAL